jgi:hypothetical protein
MPTKDIIQSARVASLVKRAEEFGVTVGPASTDMHSVTHGNDPKQIRVEKLSCIEAGFTTAL